VAGEIGYGCVVGAVCRAERAAGQWAATGDLGECRDDAPGLSGLKNRAVDRPSAVSW
jgi:hypothetical protein